MKQTLIDLMEQNAVKEGTWRRDACVQAYLLLAKLYRTWKRLFQEDCANTVAEICVHGWSATNSRQQYYLEAGSFIAHCAVPSCEQLSCAEQIRACPACCNVFTA